MKAFLLPAATMLSLAGTPGGDPAPLDSGAEIGSLMLSASQALQGAERGLAEREWGALAQHVGALGCVGSELEQLGARQGGARGARIETGARALTGPCGEMLELNEAQYVEHAAGVLDDIRRACVTCHAKLRAYDPQRGEYPARGNTVAGEVEVRTLAGEQRQDRSSVLVFLELAGPVGPCALPRRNPVISQANRQFTPRVLPVLKGTTVEFPNDDLIFHNVFSLSKTRPFDLGIYEPGDSKEVTFMRAGLVKVYCNIHPQMITNVVVLENPFYALTDAHGSFVLCDVPDGAYTLRTWHELGGGGERPLELSGPSMTRLALRVDEQRATLEHKNKFGLPYRDKY